MNLSSIISVITSLFTALKDYVSLGVSYYLGRAHMKDKQLTEVLKTQVKTKKEYIKNVEKVSLMSDSSVFDELRNKHTRSK